MSAWKYFKLGDLVADPEVWGNLIFRVTKFHGNNYCPLMSAESVRLYKGRILKVNLGVEEARLVNAPKRPFQKLKDKTVLKLSAVNKEALRELLIRSFQRQRHG